MMKITKQLKGIFAGVLILNGVISCSCPQENVAAEESNPVLEKQVVVHESSEELPTAHSLRKCGDEIEGVAVLELFSSEGCYDCPKSEKALNELISKLEGSGKNVITIAEHVDFWNDLTWGEGACEGKWEDVYSNGIYTFRQFSYAASLGIRAATPQVFFNGTSYVADPGLEELESKVDSLLNQPVFYGVCLDFNKKQTNLEKREIAVDFSFKKNIDSQKEFRKTVVPQLQVFLIESGLENTPDKGENCGTLLHHDNLSRAFTSVSVRQAKNGTLILSYPEGVNLSNCKVVGFVQNILNNQFNVLGGTAGFEFN